MKQVLDGKLIFTEWKSLLETYVGAALSFSNGEKMVHISQEFLFDKFSSFGKGTSGFGFYPLNPFIHLFNENIARMIEGGLTQHWEETEKAKWQKIVKEQVNYSVKQEEKSAKLTMANFGGIFVIMIVSFAIPSLAFLMERMYACFSRAK